MYFGVHQFVINFAFMIPQRVIFLFFSSILWNFRQRHQTAIPWICELNPLLLSSPSVFLSLSLLLCALFCRHMKPVSTPLIRHLSKSKILRWFLVFFFLFFLSSINQHLLLASIVWLLGLTVLNTFSLININTVSTVPKGEYEEGVVRGEEGGDCLIQSDPVSCHLAQWTWSVGWVPPHCWLDINPNRIEQNSYYSLISIIVNETE